MAEGSDRGARPRSILETSLYVDDLTEAKDFYRRVLGLQPFSEVDERHLFFKIGRGVLLLFDPTATADPSGEVPTHGATGPGHAAFEIPTEAVGRWRERLATRGVEVEAEIEWPAGGRSLYFRDPAGNSLELTTANTWGFAEAGGDS